MRPAHWVLTAGILLAVWIAILIIFGISIPLLLVGVGFLLSRATCVETINSLSEHNERLRQRVDEMGEILGSAADTIDSFNKGEISVEVPVHMKEVDDSD